MGVGGSGKSAPVTATNAADSGGGVLDEAASKIASEAAHPVDKSALEKAAVEGMLKALDDKWSAYYTAVQYDSFSDALSGSYTGIGLWVQTGANGSVVVSSVQDDSPADLVGMRSGDVLLSVAGSRPLACRSRQWSPRCVGRTARRSPSSTRAGECRRP